MPEAPNEKLYSGPAKEPPTEVAPCELAYAELDVTTNFSFLRGASHPDELVYTAAERGYRAMAVTDVNSLAGVVRAYEAARKVKGFKLIVGARLVFADGTPELLVWPTDRAAYGRLCRLLTRGKREAEKGDCRLTLGDFLEHSDGLLAAVSSRSDVQDDAALQLREAMGDRLSLAVSLAYGGDDEAYLEAARDRAWRLDVPLLATNHVHYHDPGRRRLQDVLTCVRHGCTIHEAGYLLFPNGERYMKSPEQMHRLFARCPGAISRGLEVAARCTFELSSLKYEYPTEAVPEGKSPSEHLRELTYAGAAERYPDGVPPKVAADLEKELKFICGSQYESYFLTVHDLVRYAKSQKILCQGRGSAANSAVCYCLGVTAVDPAKFNLVFERFASGARNEPPDIDIDFEHEKREQVIQYVYDKYGRDRAAMTGSLITYRGRSAVRDVGKVLGLSRDALDELAGKLDWWHRGTLTDSQIREAGVDPAEPTVKLLIELTTQLLGFPRHLSQHVGGMVISRSPLDELVPIENAAMEGRTVIEWDKDDLDALRLFKVDILALGMLTCLSKSMAMISERTPGGLPLELHTIPSEDRATYEMITEADTVGVFQVESRAQMSMLPRLRPETFYDLVIEVAIVRPGPIQGKMVHPYLARREEQRRNPDYVFECPKEELREVLKETLGVPLFQEQAMRVAVVAAGFTPEEADGLRRAMAAWKRSGGIERFHGKFVGGMLARGYEREFAERCFQQISGFGDYGFPESHAASFALLVYASAWLKRHHPAAFAAGLLNSQPMGFYAPAQLIRDAREHGVDVRPVDVNASEWDCTLEANDRPASSRPRGRGSWGWDGPALRLGFRQVKGMRRADADRIVSARQIEGSFTTVAQLRRACNLDVRAVSLLARADALASLKLNRREAAWDAMALDNGDAPLTDSVPDTHLPVQLPLMPLREEVVADYAATGLSLRPHPVSFVRPALDRWGVAPTAALRDEARFPNGSRAKVAGLVLVRQRPGTASGVVFVTLEDETGVTNLILWSAVYELNRPAARHARLLQADGVVQRQGEVVHVLAHRLFDRTAVLHEIDQPSRDFH